MKLIYQPLKRGDSKTSCNLILYSYSRDKSFTPLLLLHMRFESSSPNCISQNRMRLINQITSIKKWKIPNNYSPYVLHIMTQYYNDEKIHTRKSNTAISNSKFKIMMKFSKLQFFHFSKYVDLVAAKFNFIWVRVQYKIFWQKNKYCDHHLHR